MLSVRSKTIIAIVCVFLTVSLFYLYLFVKQFNDNQQLVLESRKNLVTTLVESQTAQIDKQYNARIQSFAMTRSEIMKAFAGRDRRALFRASGPVFTTLQRENPDFDQITYLLPDNSILLTVKGRGDYREPPEDSFMEESPVLPAADMGKSLSGFVYDREGLVYLVIEPVYREAEYIGKVVFGIRIRGIIDEIRKSFDMHTAVVLRDQFVEGLDNPDGLLSGDYVVYDFDDPYFEEKNIEQQFTGREQRLNHRGEVHLVFPSYAVKNPSGREIGYIVQSVDISRDIEAYHQHLVKMGLVTLTVLGLSTIILYLAFSTLYGQLLVLNQTLNDKNEELEEAGRLLEEKVAARTAQLAETNSRLQEEIELRREANRSLSRSVGEWQSTFDAIADTVIILDNNLEVVIANRAAQEMLSSDNREIVGRKCHELFAGLSTRCENCPAEDVFSRGEQRLYEMEHEFLDKSLMVTCSAIYDDGEIIGFVYTAKDITQEKKLKKQLSLAQKMEAIATLAGGIAHDFNNILGAILGNADLLLFRLSSQGKSGDPARDKIRLEDIESHVQAIKKAGNRAKELVSQILAFSRQGKTQRQNSIITPVIKEAVKLLRSSLPANIEIKSDIAPDICHIYADLSQIHQVFMNLCTNAAQAMADNGGILSVSLRNVEIGPEDRKHNAQLKPGNYLALTVEDSGHGMTPEIMERIFDPFFTTRDVGEGTGMGLAVIHGIITSHDGVLDVKSEVDAGSEFTVYFPCVEGDAAGREDVILGMPRGDEKIVFIDDEDDIVRMTTRMLEYLGYDVFPATSAEQALAIVKDDSFMVDLIITDYSMPGMSGIELAKKMAGLRPGIPIMLCSGFSESVVFDEEARKIIRRYMSKPLDMKKLANAIREVLSTRKTS